jgi:ribonuclease-3 family protein
MEENKAFLLNPLVLAFVGDGVQTLCVRTALSRASDAKAGQLHKATVSKIKAVSQSVMSERIVPVLTEREADVFRRARNAKMPTTAKHASLTEYRYATAFEAVIGYLYLIGQDERLAYLLSVAESEE